MKDSSADWFLWLMVISYAAFYTVNDLQIDFFGIYDTFRMFVEGHNPYFNSPDRMHMLFGYSLNTELRYPPPILFFSFLGYLPFLAAKAIWNSFIVSTLFVLYQNVKKIGPTFGTLLLASCLSFSVQFGFQRAQPDLLIACLVAIFFVNELHTQKRYDFLLPIGAALKLVPLVFFAYYALTRQWRRLALATGYFLGFNLVAAALFGLGMFRSFYEAAVKIGSGSVSNSWGTFVPMKVDNNWTNFQGFDYRYSMNYFGSYFSISATELFGKSGSIVSSAIVTLVSLGLLGYAQKMNRKKADRFIPALLMIIFPVLSPMSWGTSLAFSIFGLILFLMEEPRWHSWIKYAITAPAFLLIAPRLSNKIYGLDHWGLYISFAVIITFVLLWVQTIMKPARGKT